MNDTYFLDSDADGHWFIVPANMRHAWDDWTDLNPDEEAAWTPPKWAIPVNGHPARIEFMLPHAPETR